jgi:alkylated DNA repair protein alkB family protein 8
MASACSTYSSIQQSLQRSSFDKGVLPCLVLQELPEVPVIDQLTVNEYTPGVGIAPHVDTHSSFTGAIMSLSLAGGCVMVFRKSYIALNPCSSRGGDGAGQVHQGDRQVLVYLPPRSLVLMSGEARYAW